MGKIEEMLRNRPIKEKLVRLFQLITISYVLLAIVGLFETIRGKNYVCSCIDCHSGRAF